MSLANLREDDRNKHPKRDLALRYVLAATDFSSACDNAWFSAIELAREHQSKLFLAHVISPGVFSSVPPELMAAARKQAKLEAEAKMGHLLQLHGGTADLHPEVLLQEGDITDSLLRMVNEYNADLLVVGTRGHRHLKRMLLGSVAEKLFRQAACPVLIVPERAPAADLHRPHRILYPTDFSSESRAALPCATAVARYYRAELIVLNVVEGAALKSRENKARQRISVEQQLRQLLHADPELSPDVWLEVAFGVAAERISGVAVEYHTDLVVLGVHPATATAAHEAERTAYRVIRLSHSPVLTIARPIEPDQGIPIRRTHPRR